MSTTCEDCDQICADHSGRGEKLEGLDARFRLLLWGIGGACALILTIQGVNFAKLSSIEASINNARIDDARYELRLQRLEDQIQDLNRRR